MMKIELKQRNPFRDRPKGDNSHLKWFAGGFLFALGLIAIIILHLHNSQRQGVADTPDPRSAEFDEDPISSPETEKGAGSESEEV